MHICPRIRSNGLVSTPVDELAEREGGYSGKRRGLAVAAHLQVEVQCIGGHERPHVPCVKLQPELAGGYTLSRQSRPCIVSTLSPRLHGIGYGQ